MARPDRLVFDASCALEAILPSSRQTQREAIELVAAIGQRDIEAHVPRVFFAELAYVVTKAVRMRTPRLTPDEAADFLGRVDALGFEVDAADQGSLALHQAALRWHCGAYDAIYLDLAQRLGVPVATLDGGMASGARAFGVVVFSRRG